MELVQPDVYDVFTQQLFNRLAKAFPNFSSLTSTAKKKRRYSRCWIYEPSIADAFNGSNSHTLCEIIDATKHERGKAEWFPKEQRACEDARFFIVFYNAGKNGDNGTKLLGEIEAVENSYNRRDHGQIYFVNTKLHLNTTRW